MKNKLFILMYFMIIGCASYNEHGAKIQKQPLSKKDYPIRIKNLTSHSFERTQDDRYKIILKITDKGALKGNFFAEAIIDGLSHRMKRTGTGEFVYYHHIECATFFVVQFKIYYTGFTLFPSEDGKYDVFIYPIAGAHTIAITESTQEIVVSQKEIVFSCKENRETCFADNLSIINKGLTPITIREIIIEESSPIKDDGESSGEVFCYYLNERLPTSIDCGKGIVLSISNRHAKYRTSGTLVIKTDNPRQPEIKIYLAGRCTGKAISQERH